MSKLHELLAVENNLDGQAGKTRTELMKTFQDKRHLFQETRVTFRSSEEGVAESTEQQSDIQTTVTDEVKWLSKILAKAWDAAYQIDVANTLARANVLDEETGEVLLKDIPATALLQLEKRMKELHDFILTIPTLDPAKGFKPDSDKGKGIFRALDVNKPRTRKVFVPLVLAAATKEHPAQVKEGFEDRPIGMVLHQEWSSLITPAQKADLLDHCDKLTRSIKRARAKANEQEVDVKTQVIARDLLDYVFKGL